MAEETRMTPFNPLRFAFYLLAVFLLSELAVWLFAVGSCAWWNMTHEATCGPDSLAGVNGMVKDAIEILVAFVAGHADGRSEG